MADFPKTRWTLVERACGAEAEAARQALAELFFRLLAANVPVHHLAILPFSRSGSPAGVWKADSPRMSRSGGEGSHATLLEELFAAPSEQTMSHWQLDDLAASFSQRVKGPLRCSLTGLDERDAERIRAECESRGLLLESLEDLLLHPRPPLELLRMTKDFAKIHSEAGDDAFPAPVATAIYFLAIAVALVRCGRGISTLSPGDLTQGWRWGRDQQWLDERHRRLFQEALDRIAGFCGENAP